METCADGRTELTGKGCEKREFVFRTLFFVHSSFYAFFSHYSLTSHIRIFLDEDIGLFCTLRIYYIQQRYVKNRKLQVNDI